MSVSEASSCRPAKAANIRGCRSQVGIARTSRLRSRLTVIICQHFRARSHPPGKGISDHTLEVHFGLYEGYVKNVNLLNERLDALVREGKVAATDLTFAELFAPPRLRIQRHALARVLFRQHDVGSECRAGFGETL